VLPNKIWAMDDIGGAIQSFLSQPGAMEQVEAMAKQLGLSVPGPDAEGPAPVLPEGNLPDPQTLQKLMQAAAEGTKPDEATALLTALKPLLRQERQEKLDRAIRAMGMMRTAKLLSKTLEL